MSAIRRITKYHSGRMVVEGAGVNLKRSFGYHDVPAFDPFLMLDDFGSKDPEDYLAGFPWHPHRGIETVTYMLHGTVRHGDSMGNQGEIGDGQIQWMTAGRGIIHQEMPQRQADYLRGFQLWVNLPATSKMMKPRYQDIRATDIPVVEDRDGVVVKVIAGVYKKKRGPVKDIVCDAEYLDIRLPAQGAFEHSVARGHTAFVYVIEGDGRFDETPKVFSAGQVGLYGDGERCVVTAGPRGVRFLCVSGRPIGEPVAWRGPIVMNTEAELEQAFEEYRNGTFIQP